MICNPSEARVCKSDNKAYLATQSCGCYSSNMSYEEMITSYNKTIAHGANLKWKTPASRRQACLEYCNYLKSGKPKEYYPAADTATIKYYIDTFSEDFNIVDIAEAEREGKSKLLDIGYAGMLGKIPGFRDKTWQFVIQNMTHWKLRTDITSDDEKIESPILYIPEEKK